MRGAFQSWSEIDLTSVGAHSDCGPRDLRFEMHLGQLARRAQHDEHVKTALCTTPWVASVKLAPN